MTETVSNYFVFLVLPTIFIAVWSYILLYNRRVRNRIKQIEASGRHLTSAEEGISLVTLEKERAGRIGSIS
jgi:hypothetical protein